MRPPRDLLPQMGRLAPQRRDPPRRVLRRQIRPLRAQPRRMARRIQPHQDLHRPMARRIRPLDPRRRTGLPTRRPLDQLRRKPRLRVARNLQRRPMAAHLLRPAEAAALLIDRRSVAGRRIKSGSIWPAFFVPSAGSFPASQRQEIPYAAIYASGSRGALPNSRTGSNRSSGESGCSCARARARGSESNLTLLAIPHLASGYREPPIVRSIANINTR